MDEDLTKELIREIRALHSSIRHLTALLEDRTDIEEKEDVLDAEGENWYILLSDLVNRGELSRRIGNVLYRAGVQILKDFTYISPEQLYKIRNMGKVGAKEVEELCRKYGIIMGSSCDNVPKFTIGDRVVCLLNRRTYSIFGEDEKSVESKGKEMRIIKGPKRLYDGEYRFSLEYYTAETDDGTTFTLLSPGEIRKI